MRDTIIAALKVQLKRLKEDQASEAFKIAPLFLVVGINNEIARIERLLADRTWDVTRSFDLG